MMCILFLTLLCSLLLTGCDATEVRTDDHLAEMAVPILYLGAGGGFGAEEGESTTCQTVSEGVTIYEVSLQPEERRATDFGHANLFLGENAADLVWEVLRGWLVDHDTHPFRHAAVEKRN